MRKATALPLDPLPAAEVQSRLWRAGVVPAFGEALTARRGEGLIQLSGLSAVVLEWLERLAQAQGALFLRATAPDGSAGEAFLRIESGRLGPLSEELKACPDPSAAALAAALGRIGRGARAERWELPGASLDLSGTPLVMGILNVTPDSFYDGGRHQQPHQALEHATAMLEAGADILDVGGESTRPGAQEVDEAEETARVLPVIRGILERHPEALISVDTYKAGVARRAVEAGAKIVNDIGAGRLDEALLPTVAASGAGWVAMHMRGTPRTMQQDTEYADLLGELNTFFSGRLAAAAAAGVPAERIVLDPGIGFGKSAAANYELIDRLEVFHPLGCPLLIGPSRKSFLGGQNREERLEGTLAALTVAVLRGAAVLRVHDVAAAVRTVRAAVRFRDCRTAPGAPER